MAAVHRSLTQPADQLALEDDLREAEDAAEHARDRVTEDGLVRHERVAQRRRALLAVGAPRRGADPQVAGMDVDDVKQARGTVVVVVALSSGEMAAAAAARVGARHASYSEQLEVPPPGHADGRRACPKLHVRTVLRAEAAHEQTTPMFGSDAEAQARRVQAIPTDADIVRDDTHSSGNWMKTEGHEKAEHAMVVEQGNTDDCEHAWIQIAIPVHEPMTACDASLRALVVAAAAAAALERAELSDMKRVAEVAAETKHMENMNTRMYKWPKGGGRHVVWDAKEEGRSIEDVLGGRAWKSMVGVAETFGKRWTVSKGHTSCCVWKYSGYPGG